MKPEKFVAAVAEALGLGRPSKVAIEEAHARKIIEPLARAVKPRTKFRARLVYRDVVGTEYYVVEGLPRFAVGEGRIYVNFTEAPHYLGPPALYNAAKLPSPYGTYVRWWAVEERWLGKVDIILGRAADTVQVTIEERDADEDELRGALRGSDVMKAAMMLAFT